MGGHPITKPSCIYAIQCEATGRVYIGRTYRLTRRVSEHFHQLRRGEKGWQGSRRFGENGKQFQADYDEYGEDNFRVFVLEENVPPEQCQQAENRWILAYKSFMPEYGYNIRDEICQPPAVSKGVPQKPWEAKGKEDEVLPEAWTGEVVGRMHINGVTVDELAKSMGFSKGYMSQILNSKRNPADIKPRIEAALDEIIKRKQK